MKCLLPASGFFRNKLKIGKFRQKLTDFWSECNYRISKNTDISTVFWQSARGIYSKIEFYQILDNTLLHQMNNIANQKICVY